jgi:hypothetical protein
VRMPIPQRAGYQYTGEFLCRERGQMSRDEWNAYVDQHESGTWWHRDEWLDYCLAYKRGVDVSFVVTAQDGTIAALVPLLIEGARFACGGSPIPSAPLDMQISEIAAAIVYDRITRLAMKFNIRDMEVAYYPTSPVQALDTEKAYQAYNISSLTQEDRSFRTRVLDLCLPQERRWQDVRKSWQAGRTGIARLRERYEVWLPDQHPLTAETFTLLHKKIYDSPRSEATYLLHEQWAREGFARVYLAVDRDGLARGGVLWFVYKDWAYYASNACDDPDVAKLLLWDSTCDLARQGIAYAELGWQGRATTLKGKNIELFKRGLGGQDWPIICASRIFQTPMSADIASREHHA